MSIGQLFKHQFKAGDVIFGNNQARPKYVDSLPEKVVHHLRSVGHFLYIDHYNDYTFGDLPISLQRANKAYLKSRDILLRSPETERNIKFNHAANRNTSDLNPLQKAAVEEYYQALQKSRYAPLEAVKIDIAILNAKGNGNLRQFVFRQACKFGLQYIIEHTRSTVHFALDRLEMTSMVAKARFINSSGTSSVQVTTSELRKCYRNRVAWEATGRLIFYRDLLRVEAPWDVDPGLWALYDEYRIGKKTPAPPTAPSKRNTLRPPVARKPGARAIIESTRL